MSRKRYYYVKVDPSDLLTGMADLTDAERGVYVTLLTLMWDRAVPLRCGSDIERQSLARLCGCTTRRFNITVKMLLDHDKLQLNNGLLSNRRAIKTVLERGEISDVRREAANERWHGNAVDKINKTGARSAENSQNGDANASRAQQPALPLENAGLSSEKTEKKPRKNEDKIEINLPETAENSQNGYANAPPLARVRVSELYNITTTPSVNLEVVERVKVFDDDDDDDGTVELTLVCCEAAGLIGRVAAQPSMFEQAKATVQGWRKVGIDINATAIPAITAAAAKTTEPVNSLNFFGAAVDSMHSKGGKMPVKPVKRKPPTYTFDDEDLTCETFRRALANAITETAYAHFATDVRFRIADLISDGDRQILYVESRTGMNYRAIEVVDQYRTILERVAEETLKIKNVWQK